MKKKPPKSLDTIEAIGAELDDLYARVDHGDMTAEDTRELNMKLAILRQRADLIKNHALEAKVEMIQKAFEHWQQRQQIRRIS